MLWTLEVSSTYSIASGFAARCYGDFSSWHWNPGQRGLVWGWDSSLLRYPSQIFIPYLYVGIAHSVSIPPTSLNGCGFFNSIVVRLSFNSVSKGSVWWLFYVLVVILVWLCEEASHVYLCCYLGWKAPSNFW